MNDNAMKTLASGLRFPEGPIAMPDGSVLVVEIGAGRLGASPPDGRVLLVADTGRPERRRHRPRRQGATCATTAASPGTPIRTASLDPHGRASDWSGGRIERVDLGQRQRRGACTTAPSAAPCAGPTTSSSMPTAASGSPTWASMGEREIERGRMYYAKADGSMIRDVVYPIAHAERHRPVARRQEAVRGRDRDGARCGRSTSSRPASCASMRGRCRRPARCCTARATTACSIQLAVEAGGNVCVATIGAPGVAGITVLSPQGQVVEHVATPDRSTTNICFGGADLRTAYVTLSRSGQLVSLPWARPGLALEHLNK